MLRYALHFGLWVVAVPWLASLAWLCWDEITRAAAFSFDSLLLSLLTAALGAAIGVLNCTVITIPLSVVASFVFGPGPAFVRTLWFRLSFAFVTALAGCLWGLTIRSALHLTQGGGALLASSTVAGLSLGLITPAIWEKGRNPEQRQL